MTDRAVPVKIFSSEVAPERRQYFLKKWCQDERMTNFAIRDIIDWDYYIGTWLRPTPGGCAGRKTYPSAPTLR